MANWAWPHTPASNLARMILRGGPFDGEAGLFVPPDRQAPAQIVWSGWLPGVGFQAWLYEWKGETTTDLGRTNALIYRPTGRRVHADDIPPVIADAADEWSEAANLAISLLGFPGL